jgi:CHAD domain-containing protein
MAEKLRPRHSAVKFVRRIVRRDAEKALKRVDVDRPPADASIHDARKRLKRARAALRLIRKPLGRARFRKENEAFREAAKPLSEIRDAKIVVEALDALLKRATRRDRAALRGVRDMLVAHQLRVRHRASGKGALKPVVSALRSARKRADGWSLKTGGFSPLGSGVRRVYRSGRNALAAALASPLDETLHELRKQAKYLWQQLQILAPLDPRRIVAQAERAHQLSDDLGKDHDLAVLKQRLARPNRRVTARARATATRLIDSRRGELQAKALALATRVYSETPQRFAKSLEGRWEAWRN